MKQIAYSVVPMLSVRNGARAVEFYQAAFGAKEVFRMEDPSGAVVSRLSVQGAEFWVADESPEHANFSPESLGGGTARMILTVPDPTPCSRRLWRPERKWSWPLRKPMDGAWADWWTLLAIIGKSATPWVNNWGRP